MYDICEIKPVDEIGVHDTLPRVSYKFEVMVKNYVILQLFVTVRENTFVLLMVDKDKGKHQWQYQGPWKIIGMNTNKEKDKDESKFMDI